MSGEVKFGITKEPWPCNGTIHLPIMENRGVTGIWYVPTGEVVPAMNLWKSLRTGASVRVVEGKDLWYLVSAAESYVAPTGPQS